MKKFLGKIKSKKGETFIELLIAILIVAFGCFLIATMFNTSMNLNITAQNKDKDFYQAITEMESESQSKDDNYKMLITDESGKTTDVTVSTYGDGKLSAYRKN